MNKQLELQEFLRAHGWERDRWGHMHKETADRKYRMKFQAKSVRFEVSRKEETHWTRLHTGYYGQLNIVATQEHRVLRFGRWVLRVKI